MLTRAYSTFEIKAVDDEQRVIEGLASTPTTDRMGDIVEPEGAEFKLPIPLLWQHRSDQPIGQVISAKATKAGIEIKAKIAKDLLPRIDEAWALIKSGLVRGLSIGFSPIESARIEGTYGYRFLAWEWLELSAVTIPANSEATIQTVKSFDAEHLAASGSDATPIQSGASDSRVVKTQKPTRKMAKTISEQIKDFEATRQAKAARMTELMDKSAEEGRTLHEQESEEYDGIEADVKGIDEHLVRLARQEKVNAESAKPVDGSTPEKASASRAGVISVRSNVPQGTAFTRYVMALAASRGSRSDAALLAEANKHWMSTTPEVAAMLKASVPLGTTTSGSPDAYASLTPFENAASEFIELLRAETIVNRVPGMRMVPFNVRIPVQAAGTEGSWVGESAQKPVGELSFTDVTLRWTKVAKIVAISEELARFSNPSAEGLVRSDLAAGVVQAVDKAFIDPANAGISDVKPAAITNGAGTAAASGTTEADLRADLAAAFAQFNGANIPIEGCVWVMRSSQAAQLSLLLNPLGQPAFPGMTTSGGTLLGFPVITSQNVPSGVVVFFKPSEVLLADDGGVSIDVSREATLVMDDGTSPASTTTVNLWQQNAIGVRAERFINWLRRRDDAVYYITGANYGA